MGLDVVIARDVAVVTGVQRATVRKLVADAKKRIDVETCTDLHKAFHEERVARGVEMAPSEMGDWNHHIKEHIADMPVREVGKVQLRRVLDNAVRKGSAKESVAHLRRYLAS